MMFDYKSPRFNTAELCQNVLMVSVVFKAWWVLLIANVDIISINLTQWISLFRKIWVFYSLCYLCIPVPQYFKSEDSALMINVAFIVELKCQIQQMQK